MPSSPEQNASLVNASVHVQDRSTARIVARCPDATQEINSALAAVRSRVESMIDLALAHAGRLDDPEAFGRAESMACQLRAQINRLTLVIAREVLP